MSSHKDWNEGRYQLPIDVEDEAKIEKILMFKRSYIKLIFYYLFSVLTFGFVALLAKWKYSLRILFKYSKCISREAEIVIVYGRDKTKEHILVDSRALYITGAHKVHKTFSYRLYTYYLDDEDDTFKLIQFFIKNKTNREILKEMGYGLQDKQLYDQRYLTYGKNSTDIPMKSDLKIIYDEILSPFYLFQVFSCILWGYEEYYIYASVILTISVGTIILTFNTVKHNYLKLHKQAHFETRVNVYRSFIQAEDPKFDKPNTVSSEDLVPGDVIEIPNNQIMPCDLILINGTAIMNESMLTGESIPVIKQALPHNDKIFDADNDTKHILFSGTRCLETRKAKGNPNPVLGLVLRTGFSTMKGRLVRSLLFPKPENFQFYKDSLRFIGMMALIAAACFLFSLNTLISDGADLGELIIKSLDIITITVPPALATTMSIGAEIATDRLEERKIITKSQNKINVAGRIDVMCFDKTGTLTEDSLDLYGVRTVERINGAPVFAKIARNNIHQKLNTAQHTPYSDEKAPPQKMLELMATCHSLTYIRKVLSGDPLDMKMFHAIGWELRDDYEDELAESISTFIPPNMANETGYFRHDSKVHLVKRFDFVPKLQRMSVIVKDPNEHYQRVYVKGSPEKIRDLCIESTIPQGYNEMLSHYTQSGLRVIACATKLLSRNVGVNENVERDEFEKDLEFIGMIIFQNKLKDATPASIEKLKKAKIRPIMITGDNALTAICVARDCGIITAEQKIVLCELKESENDPNNKHMVYKLVDLMKPEEGLPEESMFEGSSRAEINIEIELQQSPQKKVDKMQLIQSDKSGNKYKRQNTRDNNSDNDGWQAINNEEVAAAITGEAFSYLKKQGTDVLLYKKILRKAKVFARMRPEEKALVVEELQNRGHLVGMCGDGANDCPALKVADVGISLSEAEASIAAPFLSKIADISCIDTLLREGRAALVTSFQCFKYMALYSIIQTVTVVCLYKRRSNLTDPSFLYIDLFLIIPLAVTMSYTGPHDTLSPKQPTASLMSVPILTSIIGQILIQTIFQVIMLEILLGQSWYETPKELHPVVADYNDYSLSYDSTVLFLFSNFQYIATVVAFSIGKPFRKEFYTNQKFTLSVIVLFLLSVALIMNSNESLIEFMQVMEIPNNFKTLIITLAVINFILTIVFEKIAVPAFVRRLSRDRRNLGE